MVRIKSRYLLVRIVYPKAPDDQPDAEKSDLMLYNQPTTDGLSFSKLAHAIRSQVASLFGDYGAGTVDRSLQVKYLSTATSTFILKASRAHYRMVWAALTFMDRVPVRDGRLCVFQVVHVSGTIKKVENEVIRRSRIFIHAAKEELGGKSSGTLEALFGSKDSARDVAMVDALDDSDEAEVDYSEDDG